MTRRTKPGPDEREGRGETDGRRRMRLSRRELMRTALGAGAAASLGWSLTEPDEVLAQGAGDAPQPGGELFYGSTSGGDTPDPANTRVTGAGGPGGHLCGAFRW